MSIPYFDRSMRSLTRYILVCFLFVCAACSGIPSPFAPTSTVASYTDRDAEDIAAIAKMEGHLRMSLLDWDTGRYDLAAMHAGHPVDELFVLAARPLKAKNADTPLKNALDSYTALASKPGDAQVVHAAYTNVINATHSAELTLGGPWLDDPTFQGEVIHELVDSISDNYRDISSKQGDAQLIPYQDSYAFLSIAKERYQTIAAKVKAKNTEEAKNIDLQFAFLDQVFPDGHTVPQQLTDMAKVDAAVDGIMVSLQKAVGRPSGARAS